MDLGARPLPLAHRFFFALRPDDVTARRTRAFAAEQFGEQGLLRPEHHHMTLAITEDVDPPHDGLIAALRRAGDAVVDAAPFELRLDRLSGSHRSLALRPEHAMPPLRRLQAQIAHAMAREMVPMRAGWTFSPHQTLGYRAGRPFSRPVAGFRWDVRAFVLVHSFVGWTRHENLGCWPLAARQYPLL